MQDDAQGERKTEFKIEGMRSVEGEKKLEESFLQLKGVKEVSISFSTRKGYVVFHKEPLPFEALNDAAMKCGCTLSLKEDRGSKGLPKELKQFLVSGLISLPLILSTAYEAVKGEPLINPPVQLLLASTAQILFGSQFYLGALRSLKAGAPGADLLIALGTFSAYLYSFLSFALSLKNHPHFDTSALIITCALFGKWVEAKSFKRARGLVAELAHVLPEKARMRIGGFFEKKDASDLFSGDIVKVLPGEKIPVDGVILEGVSIIDESTITGEGKGAEKKSGDFVFGGTIVLEGELIVRAEKVGKDTAAGVVYCMVEKALKTKAPIQRTADLLSLYLVPAALLLALVTFSCYAFLGEFEKGLVSAIAVMVVASPSAIQLAAPAVVAVAFALGAKSGILFRSASAIEKAGKLDLVIFDKTGTLTLGEPHVAEIIPFGGESPARILSLAASLEMNAEHPLARAIIAEAKKEAAPFISAEKPQLRPGAGVSGEVGGVRYFLGSKSFAEEAGFTVPDDLPGSKDKTEMFLFSQAGLIGMLKVDDPVRESGFDSVRQLKLLHVVPVMVTGDNHNAARSIAERVGISAFFSDVLPKGKLEKVEFYKRSGHRVGVVGDGINDAFSIAEADVGFAMGSGVRIAMESADVSLLGNDLMSVGTAIHLSRKSLFKVRANLLFAFFYNTLLIPAGVFGFLSPAVAALLMSLSSLAVLVNSLSLRR